MGADRARVTHDPTRQYRAVVKQQGRVELEADWNEATAIADDARRAGLLEVVGPSGTPDNGYEIGGGLAPFDFSIGAGTMYVGGERVELSAPTTYAGQPDWADQAGDPAWIDPATGAGRDAELVYLELLEHEVSAVEDAALREVALGGPDTAQRGRLVQRIVRFGTDGRDCDAAMADAEASWAALGLEFVPETMRLQSRALLQAGYEDPGSQPDECEPEAHGGYLGADNQLVRVQVSGADRVIWGFDNASFLYRVTAIDAQTLELAAAPVDTYHFPRVGQAVEILRTAASIDGTNAIASLTGAVQTLAAAYNPDTRRISLPGALPAECLDPAASPVLFLRVWEQDLQFVPGTPLALGSTGLRVTLTGGPPFSVGDFWQIAVRPSTPSDVYPSRFLVAPQPPDGPRRWVCPLAVIDWSSGSPDILEDCRERFDNLVTLTKHRNCCTATVGDGTTSRGDFTDIQAAVDFVTGKGGGVVCLLPGTFELADAVVVRGSNVTISGCAGLSPVVRAEGAGPAIVLEEAVRVTLESLWIRADSPLGVAGVLGGSAIRFADCRLENHGGEKDGSGIRPALVTTSTEPGPLADLIVEGCNLIGVPAASLQADTIRFTSNRLGAGGLWLREGCTNVEVLGNLIEGGRGPGIMLGGLVRDEKPPLASAGLAAITVTDNRIASMSASGITTVDGELGGFLAAFRSVLDDVSIESNRIEECVTDDSAMAVDGEAAGGIVLRRVLGLRIHGNTIIANGARGGVPTCGIFLHTCVDVDVSNNTVVGNGTPGVGDGKAAYQGGIIAPLVLGGALGAGFGSSALGLGSGTRIHDNVVVAPLGQAVLVLGIGAISVADNALTSLEVADQPISLAAWGRCVFVFDVGQSAGLAGSYGGFGHPVTPHFGTLGQATGFGLGTVATALALADGRVLVHGNQITLETAREAAQTLATACVGVLALEHAGFQDNQVRVVAPGGLVFDTIVVGAGSAQTSANRFIELPLRTLASCVSWASTNGVSSNQATHCILVGGPGHLDMGNQVQIAIACAALTKLFQQIGG